MKTRLPIVMFATVGFVGLATEALAGAPQAAPFVTPQPAPILSLQSARTAVPAAKSDNECQVDHSSTWVDVCPGTLCSSIQDAVDTGKAYIRVCAGTYPEDVIIGPGVKVLKGDGPGRTVVTGIAGTAGPIIEVLAGSNVRIQGLTVDGRSAMSAGNSDDPDDSDDPNGPVYGIRYSDASGAIKHVEVLNIRNQSGSDQGIGIRVQTSDSSQRAKVVVASSKVKNYTRVGINGNGEGVHLTALFNKVAGPSGYKLWAPNGIQIARGAKGNVVANYVDNNPSPNVPGGAGSGILLFCAGETTVAGNTVTRADLGIALADQANAHVAGNLVKDAYFDGISLQFLGLYFGDIGCTSLDAPKPVENNRVVANHVRDSGDTGVSLVNFDYDRAPYTPNDNLLMFNKIRGSGDGASDAENDGIHVFTFTEPGDSSPSYEPTGNTFELNTIKDSTDKDAVDETRNSGSAGTANIWNRNRCTSADPTGLCD